MGRGIVFIFLVGLSFAKQGFSSELGNLFSFHFDKHYESGRCGQNVLTFAEAMEDTDGMYILTIENKGFSVFGMVNAERARGQRFRKPADVESNWYHHVVLLSDEGLIYDFDYTTRPSIVGVEEYIEKMFLDEVECTKPQYGEFCAGRETKLKEYEIESVPVNAVLAKKKVEPRRATLGAVLKNWKVTLH